jgi:hypothetical protein
MSKPLIWYEEHVWNFTVLQRVQICCLVIYSSHISNKSYCKGVSLTYFTEFLYNQICSSCKLFIRNMILPVYLLEYNVIIQILNHLSKLCNITEEYIIQH